MAIFSLAQRTTSTTAATPTQELIPGANNAYRILEYGFTQSAATAGVYGLGRAAAAGVTPAAPTSPLAEDAGDTTAAAMQSNATTWTTAPTVPANFFRRISCAATIGVGTIWTFPRGIKSLKGTSNANNNLVLWIIATAAAVDSWYVADE